MRCELEHVVARDWLVKHRLPAGRHAQVVQESSKVCTGKIAPEDQGEQHLGPVRSLARIHRTRHQSVEPLVERQRKSKADLPVTASSQ